MQKKQFQNSFWIYVGIGLALLLLAPYFGFHILTSAPLPSRESQTPADTAILNESDEETTQTSQESETSKSDSLADIEDLLKR